MALTLQREVTEGMPIATLQNLRTEIVLSDEARVGIWFSFGFRLEKFQQDNRGKRSATAIHQMRVELITLFPKHRETKSAEDET